MTVVIYDHGHIWVVSLMLDKVSPCGDVRDRLPTGPHPLAPAPARGSGGNRASGGGEGSTGRVTHI